LYLGHFLKPEGRQCQVIQTLSPTSFWFGINANSPRLRLLKNRKAAQRVLEQAIAKTGIFSGELQTTSVIPYGVAGSRAPAARLATDSRLEFERASLERIAASAGRIRLTLREVHQETYGWKQLFQELDPRRRIFDIEFLSNADFFERYYGGKLDIYLVGASVSRDDPSEVLTFFRRQDLVNQSGVREPFVDGMIEQIANARDSDEVRFLARQADLWIREQAYVVPLFSKRFSGCVSPRLAGYRFSPLGPLSMDYSSVRFRD
jgi:ABC-type oligopeptide transport system substrate-binding subunit